MITVVCDRKKIYNRTGMDIVKGTITGNLFRDCFLKTFMIIDEDEAVYIVGDSLDRGDFEYRAKNVDRMVFASTYLTYTGGSGKRKTDETADYLDAFCKLIPKGQTLKLPKDIAVDSYCELSQLYEVKDDFQGVSKRYNLYSREIGAVLKQIHENDEVIREKALALFIDEATRKAIEPYVRREADTRFESLNKAMKAGGVSVLLLSSAMNIQEVAALNFSELREKEVLAFYNAGSDIVYVISAEELEFTKDMVLEKEGLTLKEAFLGADFSGVAAIEEASLAISRYKELGLQEKNNVYFTKALREWREGRSGEDLAYYIIAARLTAYAIDGAKKWAEEMYYSNRRFTENEVYEEYTRLKYEFIEMHQIPVFLENYDPCTYSSDRSEYCCTNTEFLIPSSAGSMRIDNGELVKDKYGYVQATSDIARTVCFNPAVRKTSDLLLKIMREEIIPNIKSGMTYAEIWEMGTKPLFQNQEKLKELDMIPEYVDLYDLYKRNIGHGMSKQTRTANFITEFNQNVLKDCSVGNIELPFNFRKNMVAVEDMWFCTKEGTINITVD